jgi:hypothetical protein
LSFIFEDSKERGNLTSQTPEWRLYFHKAGPTKMNTHFNFLYSLHSSDVEGDANRVEVLDFLTSGEWKLLLPASRATTCTRCTHDIFPVGQSTNEAMIEVKLVSRVSMWVYVCQFYSCFQVRVQGRIGSLTSDGGNG